MSRRNPESLVLKITLLLTSMLMVMVTTAVAPALPAIQAHLAEVSRAALWVRLLLTLPALFIAATAPVAGYIIDRIGRRPVLVRSTLLFGISGVAGYVILTLPLLLINGDFAMLEAGDGTMLYLFLREGGSKAEHTVAGWVVEDIEVAGREQQVP